MIFTETKLKGAYILDIEKLGDSRGFFARAWCEKEAENHGVLSRMVQANISFNLKKGTLRGLHYQVSPSREGKLVRVTKGSIFDVIVDLRPQSKTFLQHVTTILSAENYRTFYIPPGLAHGFQTLEDNTEVFYQMTDFYEPSCARGVRWNDPAFAIDWPADERTILERDATYPDFHKSIADELKGL